MRALAAALLLLPAAAVAQEEPCAALWARLAAVLEVPADAAAPGAAPAADGWCEVRDATLVEFGPPGVRVEVGALRWRGEGLDALAAGTGLPTAVEVEVEDLRTPASTGDATLDWAYGVQAARLGIDGRAALGWDAPTRELALTELVVDFPGRSRIDLTATVAGIDLSSLAAARASLGGAGLARLRGSVTTDGLFEGYLLFPLAASLLLQGPDPQAAFEEGRAQGLAAVADLPPAIFPDPTRAEAAEVLRALPNPLGTLSFDLAVDGPPIGAARFAGLPPTLDGPAGLADAWPAFEGVTLRLGWEPLPPED